MPLPREGRVLDYSRWQQNLIGVLQTDIGYSTELTISEYFVNKADISLVFLYSLDPKTDVTIDARLAYRNKGDKDNEWKYYASSLETRSLECIMDEISGTSFYDCGTIPLFELGSLHHDYYLLNVRLPRDTEAKMNYDLGYVRDLHLSVIYQNGGFTKVWVSLKTVFFPFIVGIMIWFWHRVHLLSRSPALLEYMLLYLGGALTLLNLPLEWFTLVFDMPFMLLLGDIKQGVFYATLLSFWLVFAGEHMLVSCFSSTYFLFVVFLYVLFQIQETGEKKTLKSYWRHLNGVIVGCVSLFMFDMCERGTKLRNPFYSIWGTNIGANLAMTFIVLAGISAATYFLFLCYMIWKVFSNISIKRSALPAMSSARRLHYEGIIYRFKFLMLATLVCAALTIVGFILGQVAEGQWKWDDNLHLEFTSAFFTGVYGMWNIYIFALIVLYAPSHKQWPQQQTNQESILSEEIEFTSLPSLTQPTEVSSLTQFVSKAALD